MAQYFYDSQVRRFLTQFGAILSHFDVQFGSDPKGNPILKRVPVIYGDASRQASTVINNNSASSLPSAPMMSYYISGIEYDQRRTQDPYFIDKVNVRQRTYNQDTGLYETTQGNAFTVERIMPVPYTLRVTVDIWTTSTQQRLEIFEQLGVLFNPSMEIQSTDNFVDWTSLSVVYQDGLTWNSRTVPQGTGNAIDITSWKFYMPIWISSPIKVQKLGMIQKIIASIYKGSALIDMKDDALLLGTRQKITPYGYQLLLVGTSLQVLPANQPIDDNQTIDLPPTGPNTDVYWHAVLNAYGTVRPGVSTISLENQYMSTEIVGTFDYDPVDDRLLIFTIDSDTLPADTLLPVDSIIDPQQKWPGGALVAAAVGQRYLIVTDLPQQRNYNINQGIVPNWPGLTAGASANDIIEYGTIVTRVLVNGNQLVGSTVLQLESIDGVVVGYAVTDAAGGGAIGLVTSVDYNSMTCIIDTALTVDIINQTPLNFTGTGWFISYNAPASTTVDYVTNTTSGIQYRLNNNIWRKSYEGYYDQGSWNITI